MDTTVVEQRAVRGLRSSSNAPSCSRRREDAVQPGADEDSRDATSATTSHLRIIVAKQQVAAVGYFGCSNQPQAGRSCQEGAREEPDQSGR